MKHKEAASSKAKVKNSRDKAHTKNSAHEQQENTKNQKHNFMHDLFNQAMKMRMPDFTDISQNVDMQRKQIEQVVKAQSLVSELAHNMSNLQMKTMKDSVEEFGMVAHNLANMKTLNPVEMMKNQEAMMDKVELVKKYQEMYSDSLNQSTQKMLNLMHEAYNQNMDR
jgi:hypothetical protein